MLLAPPGRAQGRAPLFQPAVRLDAFFSRVLALQAGVGVSVPAGTNLRVSLVGAAGASTEHGRRGVSGRIDALGRFLLDPTFGTRWVPYVAGGLSLRYDRVPRWRAALVLLVGMGGPKHGRVVPFLEAGWGDGVRVGFGFRAAIPGRR